MLAEIAQILPDSIAEEAGMETGDLLVTINGKKIRDIIEYKFACAEEYLEVEIEKKDGEVWVLEIEKDYDEDLGIQFYEDTFDKTMICRNKCPFCFVAQMPKGLRKSLYVKDDDFRLSFLHGNFITLTNLTKAEMKRIVKYHLSPLYISVHATDSEIRKQLLNNEHAGEIMEQLQELKKHNIEMHLQIVLCPGINDGSVLRQTIADLTELLPQVLSIAVVPVGLTKYHNEEITAVSKKVAKDVITTVTRAAENFLKLTGRYLIAAADEFYLLAGLPLPATKYYDNFPQYENGVGISRAFVDDFSKASRKLLHFPGRKVPNKYILTGISGAKVLQPLLEEFAKRSGITTQIITVSNQFFGPKITVAGLITGSDCIQTLNKLRLEEGLTEQQQILVPDCMFKQGEELFLDGLNLKRVAETTNLQLKVVPTNGAALLKALME